MKIGLKVALIVALSLVVPFSVKACEVKPFAKAYVNQINAVVAGSKPKIVIEKGIDESRYGFYQDGTIHVFKGDYSNSCIDDLPFLKSVIAHEYAHHMESRLRKVVNLKGERLAFVGEHAIGDEILGDAFYDNDLKKKDLGSYEKVVAALKTSKISKNFKNQNNTALSKVKK